MLVGYIRPQDVVFVRILPAVRCYDGAATCWERGVLSIIENENPRDQHDSQLSGHSRARDSAATPSPCTQVAAAQDARTSELQGRVAAAEAARQRAETALRSAQQEAELRLARVEAQHAAQLEVSHQRGLLLTIGSRPALTSGPGTRSCTGDSSAAICRSC